jgi:hypothetical protein
MSATVEAYTPPGFEFYDAASDRTMLLVDDGPWAGWIVYRHPDGQWVSLRVATAADIDRIFTALLHNFAAERGYTL